MDVPASTGRQTSNMITLGNGDWELLSASVSVAYTGGSISARKAHIAYRYKTGEGLYLYQNIVSGYVAPDIPLCLSGIKGLKGPGELYSVVLQPGTDTHDLQVTYRRLSH